MYPMLQYGNNRCIATLSHNSNSSMQPLLHNNSLTNARIIIIIIRTSVKLQLVIAQEIDVLPSRTTFISETFSNVRFNSLTAKTTSIQTRLAGSNNSGAGAGGRRWCATGHLLKHSNYLDVQYGSSLSNLLPSHCRLQDGCRVCTEHKHITGQQHSAPFGHIEDGQPMVCQASHNHIYISLWDTLVISCSLSGLGMHRIAICIILQEPDSTG